MVYVYYDGRRVSCPGGGGLSGGDWAENFHGYQFVPSGRAGMCFLS